LVRSSNHRKLELKGNAGVLLGPERNESFRNPPLHGAQTVEAGVAGRANSDQQLALMDAGLPMMHMEALPCPAGLASAAVALQNVVAEAGETLAGVGRGAIAGAAEAGDKGEIVAAGAEQGPLERNAESGGRKCQKRLYSKIAFANRHYHRLLLSSLASGTHSAQSCGNIMSRDDPFSHVQPACFHRFDKPWRAGSSGLDQILNM
jgi:hypothetical protein